ncbi:MAG: FCSD flavin-binding domain-containing protein [Burkholderiales bacterium]|jgi:NADPH-dependent 2,4-dienoyl-CoA reductase/sulfur reductase-like enzyme|nr:FCSD flavin-binding domain-containing protein [Burkholderiales bacterium]
MSIRNYSRRDVLKFSAAGVAVGTLGACATSAGAKGKVVVVGGGWGGSTTAKYLRLWSDGGIDVTLIEPNTSFVSCPISNLVIGGSRRIEQLTTNYDGLRRHGVNVVHDTVTAIDPDKRQVRLASGQTLPFDRAVVSPGIEFMFEQVKGMSPAATETIPHAWKAGPQTLLLRRQLEAMANGGVVIMSIPLAPYRCPPGPYERACQIAHYLKANKPKSKLIVLDANPQVTSKGPLFTRVWKEDYAGILEYKANMAVAEVDVGGRRFVTNLGDSLKGDVLNLIPPQRAGNIARDAGLITANNRWCEVDWVSTESIKVKNVHVIGDATLSAPAMPKSGHMANQHGKAAAAAIVELMNGRAPVPPMMANTCYSFVDDRNAIHVASVHRWNAEKKTMEVVPGASGVSGQDRSQWVFEGQFAWGWAQTVWSDMLG